MSKRVLVSLTLVVVLLFTFALPAWAGSTLSRLAPAAAVLWWVPVGFCLWADASSHPAAAAITVNAKRVGR